jgi:hypothetical protein
VDGAYDEHAYPKDEQVYAEDENPYGHSPPLLEMRVRLELRNGRPVVYVENGCSDSAPAWVRDITFLDPLGPDVTALDIDRPHPAHCSLTSYGGGTFPVTGWEYGVSMPGYTVSRACEPLQPGREYYVMVIGSGVGDAEFEINAHGGLDIIDDGCEVSKP